MRLPRWQGLIADEGGGANTKVPFHRIEDERRREDTKMEFTEAFHSWHFKPARVILHATRTRTSFPKKYRMVSCGNKKTENKYTFN